MINYTVYINNYCNSCERVTEFLMTHNIPCEIINMSNHNKQPPQNGLMIYPALYSGNTLLAYGDDIIQKLMNKNSMCIT